MAAQATAPTPMQLLAVGLLLVGFAFKVSAVPFHMWTPDAYEARRRRSPASCPPASKAAAFAAFVRVFLSAFEPLRPSWSAILWVDRRGDDDRRRRWSAWRRSSVKRMLAYLEHRARRLSARRRWSRRTTSARAAVLFYLLAYAVTNIGAFGVIALLGHAPSGRTIACATTPACGTTHPGWRR